MPQTPSVKVTTQFLAGTVLFILGQLLSDTSWTAWLPDQAKPFVPFVLLLLAAIVAYLKGETNPPASSFRYRLPDDYHPQQ